MKGDEIYRKRVQINVVGGGYGHYGEVIERSENWLVLKSDTRYGMVEGAKKGESIFSYIYVRVDHIVSIGFELVEKKV